MIGTNTKPYSIGSRAIRSISACGCNQLASHCFRATCSAGTCGNSATLSVKISFARAPTSRARSGRRIAKDMSRFLIPRQSSSSNAGSATASSSTLRATNPLPFQRSRAASRGCSPQGPAVAESFHLGTMGSRRLVVFETRFLRQSDNSPRLFRPETRAMG